MEDNKEADNSLQTETKMAKSRPGIGRLILRVFLLVVIPIIAVVFGAHWYEKTGRYVETENAYVKTNVIAISADIDGRVTEVFVDENQLISEGDLLFKLDPNTYAVAIQMAESKREKVRQDISALQAEYYQILAEIEEKKANAAYKKADVAYHKREARRQRMLIKKSITTRARLDEAESKLYDVAQGNIKKSSNEINNNLNNHII